MPSIPARWLEQRKKKCGTEERRTAKWFILSERDRAIRSLITVKGKRLIEEADVIIYAGSLVNPQVLAGAKPTAEIYNSAGMTLPEVIEVMKQAEAEGKQVARVHTGDPSIYGAHREQMVRLDELGIAYEVVPGVSSFLATAAVLKREYTLPGGQPDRDPDENGRAHTGAGAGKD